MLFDFKFIFSSSMFKKLIRHILIFGLVHSYVLLNAQLSNSIDAINNYKAIILKPEDKYNEFNSIIEEQLTKILKTSNFSEILNTKALLSAEGEYCDWLTLRYKVKNTSASSVILLAEFEFIDCDYTIVYQSTHTTKSGFYNKKAVLKATNNALSDFNTYAYAYNPPEKKPEQKIEEAVLAETVVKESISETSEIQYRGGTDPLKGLDVASAKQDIQIGNYYALIIGIDSYSNEWPELKNAVHDAQTISDVLNKNYVFHHITTLYNSQATRTNIIKAFEGLISSVNSNDNVFIYYSGHGEFNEAINKGFWVPVDAKSKSMSDYISNNDIQSFLSGIRSKHTLLVSDACFSGDLFRGKTLSIPYEDSYKYYYKVHSLPSRKAISSGGIEPVMDGGRDGHSVFSYYFLRALNDNSKKFYDAGEIFERIKIPVVNNSEQTPYYSPIKNTGDEGGQFIFIQKDIE